MRLQIAALPQQWADNPAGWRIPFMVVLDEVPNAFAEEFAELRAALQRDVREAIGAEGILAFADRVEVVPPWGDHVEELDNLDNLDEQVRDIVGRRIGGD